ncbi:MAG: hypothetical protein KIS94_11380 [Chitinophagales bacterium]|nr:hypothetical protein [Chitinophagales bacterium]
MKLHRVLLKAVIQGLADVLLQKRQADTTVEQLLVSNKNWGARDRHFIADNIYTLIRYKRLYEYCAAVNATDESALWQMLGAKLLLEGVYVSRIEEFSLLNAEGIKTLAAQAQTIRKIRESVPDWLDQTGVNEVGEEQWEKEIHALNGKAGFSIRINTLKTNMAVVKSILTNEGIDFSEVPNTPDALLIHSRKNFRNFPAYKNGLFEIQDVASQLVAPMLAAEPGMMVIDGCAGAGGKALHLAALMHNQGEILAVDIKPEKLAQLKLRATRSGVTIIEPFNAEQLTRGTQTKLANAVDRILIDAPCSGSGVLRRKPDAKWSLTPAFISELRQTQAQLLQLYAPMLKPGGILVYSTCSIFSSENEKQIQTFLVTQASNFELLEEKKISPAQTGFDGFYMAKLKKLR